MQAGRAGREAKGWWAKQLKGCDKLQLLAQRNPVDPPDPTTAKANCRISADGLHHLKRAAALLKTSSFAITMAAFQVMASDCHEAPLPCIVHCFTKSTGKRVSVDLYIFLHMAAKAVDTFA